jgi:hypothetical protein
MDEYAPATESSQLLIGVQSQGLDPGTHEGVLHNRSITVDEAIETIGVQFSAFFVCQAVRLLFSVEDLQ